MQYQSVVPSLYQSIAPAGSFDTPAVTGPNANFNTMYQQTILASNRARNSSAYKNYLESKKIQQMNELGDQMKYDKTLEDIGNYIKYAKEDYIAGVTKNNSNLADALQQATESYGAGMLGSGVQIARSTEMINDSQNIEDNLLLAKKQAMSKYGAEENYARAVKEDITDPTNAIQDAKIKYKPTKAMPIEEAFIRSKINLQ